MMLLTTTPEIDCRLSYWSKITNQPPDIFVHDAINEALDDWEDYRDALRICAEVDAGTMKTYSLPEVEAHLDALES